MIHYVIKGSGTLYSEKGEYKVGHGQIFIVTPYENAYYVADESDPWEYIWIAFNGRLAKKLDTLISAIDVVQNPKLNLIIGALGLARI